MPPPFFKAMPPGPRERDRPPGLIKSDCRARVILRLVTVLPWECPFNIPISQEMLDTVDRLHDADKLAGGVRVESTTDEATYRHLVNASTAEVEVTGLESGVVYVRWDGATRTSRAESYGRPPSVSGLPE